MASMISVKWDKNRCAEKIEPHAGWVFFSFKQGETALWSGYTANLPLRLSFISKKAEENAQYKQLCEAADTLKYEVYPQAIDALIRHKVYIHKRHPLYQQSLNISADYVYLALDARRFPFVSLQTFTTEDWIYIGPWRSRFFLMEVLDSLSRILKIPFCETGSYPCEKLEKEICNGYCLALAEDYSSAETPGLDKLKALLEEAYLHPNNGILEMVAKERDRYFDDLEFIKADLLNDEVENLKKYRDWLNFLYVSKELAFTTDSFSVEGGLLRSCNVDGAKHKFPRVDIEYRPNERLALNLQDLDEARVIYEYHLKHQA